MCLMGIYRERWSSKVEEMRVGIIRRRENEGVRCVGLSAVRRPQLRLFVQWNVQGKA